MSHDEVDVLVVADPIHIPPLVQGLLAARLRVHAIAIDDPGLASTLASRLTRRGVVFIDFDTDAGALALASARAVGHLTCVALTAPAQVAAALAAGADDVVPAPWGAADLLARVEVARARARAVDPELTPWPTHSPDALVVLDDAGTITAWNVAAADLLGHEARDVIGRPLAALLDDPALSLALRDGSAETIGDVRLRHADGRLVAHDLHVARWRLGERRRVGLRIDPTVDVAAELMRIASFPELSPHPVFELTPAGDPTYKNPALLALPAGLRDALLSAACRQRDADPERPGSCEVRWDDRWFHLDVHPTPQWESVRVYAHDVTERKRAELSLREAHATLERAVDERTHDLQREVVIRKRAEEAALAANAAKSAFLATMSHELRTPLNAIIGYAEMIQEDLGEASESAIDVDRLLASARHLLGLIGDILDLSKIEAGQMAVIDEPVDLGEILAEVLAALAPSARARHNELRGAISPALPRIRSDARAIRQILTNLVGNAVKFTREGVVTVRASVVTSPHAAIVIEVEDTGIGIPAAKLRTIFEPFTQADSSTVREYGGTGLGLTISRKLAELLGGALDVASEVGVGSTFTLHLPLGPKPAHADHPDHPTGA